MAGERDTGTDPFGADAVERPDGVTGPGVTSLTGPRLERPGAPVAQSHRLIEVPPTDLELEPEPPPGPLGARPLFPLHPAVNRLLAVLLGLAWLEGAGVLDASFAEGVGNLAWRMPVVTLVIPLAIVAIVTVSSVWRRRRHWQQEALDQAAAVALLVLAAVGALHGGVAEDGAPGVLCLWAVLLLQPLQWLRHPRAERAWLLEETRWYWLRGFAAPVLGIGMVLPATATWLLLQLTWNSAERMDRIEALLADQGETGCRVLEEDSAADALARLPVLLFGPRDGSLGRALSRCVERTVALDQPLCTRLRQTVGDDLSRSLSGSRHNQDAIAATLAVRDRLRRRLRKVAGSLDPQARERYGHDLVDLAERTGVCDNPFLATEAALLAQADPDGVLGDCGERFLGLSEADFRRAGLAWVDALGRPEAYTVDLNGTGALRSSGFEHLEGVFLRGDHASSKATASTWDAVLVRPREDSLERTLVLRMLPADQITKSHRLHKGLSGNEVYVIAYGVEEGLVDTLRDEWNLLSAAPVSRKTCRAMNSSRANRWRLVPERGGDAILFAQGDWKGETDEGRPIRVLRLVHGAKDPCR